MGETCTKNGRAIYTVLFLPSSIQGNEYRWLNIPENSMPRLGLAARITLKLEEKALTRYFLDFQANLNNTFIVIVWVERTYGDEYGRN